MSRTPIVLREVRIEDAPVLAELWLDEVRPPGGASEEQLRSDVTLMIERALANPEDRLVVAEYDGEPAGAVYLRIEPLSPLSFEPVLKVFSPTVFPRFRRLGVGRRLMESAAQHAEENGIGQVAAASLNTSREAHRFLARLALGPRAMLRVGPTPALRAKLVSSGRRGSVVPAGRQPLGVLLAQRRTRRQRA